MFESSTRRAVDKVHRVVEDIHDHNHGVRVESELSDELEVPVRQGDTRRQNPVVEEVLPAFGRLIGKLPEVLVVLWVDVNGVVDGKIAGLVR